MHPLVSDLGSLVEPDFRSLVELVEGVELGAFEEVIPHEPEGLFFFTFSVGVANGTSKGLEPVVAGEVQETRVPDGQAVGRVAAEHGGGHVVEDESEGTTLEVFEGVCEAFEQSGLTFVAVKVHPELARST
jgi:hypothetical protein